jgi:hypothetical protein
MIDAEKLYKKQAIEAAKDLCYEKEVVDKIKAASNSAEIDRILRAARQGSDADKRRSRYEYNGVGRQIQGGV